jgi:putative endonuclease
LTREAAERRGRRGETLAAWYLRLKGYRILGHRIRTPRGEIDLVAKRGRTIAFVEVKTRETEEELGSAIDEYGLSRVAAAAEILSPRYANHGEDIRIDVILIAPGCWPQHVQNAWMG